MHRLRGSIVLTAVLVLSLAHFSHAQTDPAQTDPVEVATAAAADEASTTCDCDAISLSCQDAVDNRGAVECHRASGCCGVWKDFQKDCEDQDFDGIPQCLADNEPKDVCPDFKKVWTELLLEEPDCDFSEELAEDQDAYSTLCDNCSKTAKGLKDVMHFNLKDLEECELEDGQNAKIQVEQAHKVLGGICLEDSDGKFCYAEFQSFREKREEMYSSSSVSVSSSSNMGDGGGSEDVDVDMVAAPGSGDRRRRVLLQSLAAEEEETYPFVPEFLTHEELCLDECSKLAAAHVVYARMPRSYEETAAVEGSSGGSTSSSGEAEAIAPDADDDGGRRKMQRLLLQAPAPLPPAEDCAEDDKECLSRQSVMRPEPRDEKGRIEQTLAGIEAACAMTVDEYEAREEEVRQTIMEEGATNDLGVDSNDADAVGKSADDGDITDDDDEEVVEEEEPVVMNMKATMAMSKDEFTEDKQTTYLTAVIAASGATSAEILSIESTEDARRRGGSNGGRRRGRALLAAGITVETQLEFPPDTDADALGTAAEMTDSVNAELENLGADDMVVTVQEVKEVTRLRKRPRTAGWGGLSALGPRWWQACCSRSPPSSREGARALMYSTACAAAML